MSEFVSHGEALQQLGLTEDELNDLVARGELRAFRDGDDVNFKSEDIAALRRSRETEPTIVLSDTQAEEISIGGEDMIDLDSLSTEETVLNIEGLLEDETEGTTPIPGSDLLEDDLLEGIGDDTVLDTDDLDLDLDDDTIVSDDDTLIAGGARSVTMVKKQSHGLFTATLVVCLIIALLPALFLLNMLAAPGGAYPIGNDSFLLMGNSIVEGIIGLF
ncbi:MAG: hypothetical protein KDC38_03115 [Planctomycetes bacterium]|nr:hypothetical protein [Planctomycetota bacterium]